MCIDSSNFIGTLAKWCIGRIFAWQFEGCGFESDPIHCVATLRNFLWGRQQENTHSSHPLVFNRQLYLPWCWELLHLLFLLVTELCSCTTWWLFLNFRVNWVLWKNYPAFFQLDLSRRFGIMKSGIRNMFCSMTWKRKQFKNGAKRKRFVHNFISSKLYCRSWNVAMLLYLVFTHLMP